MKRKKKHHRAYLKIFLPFALFSSLCILIFAVVISLILSAGRNDAYFQSEFYRVVANTVSIALIVFSISFFCSCILAYRPVKMIMTENEDLSAAEKTVKIELIKKYLYELCVYGKSSHELSQLPAGSEISLNLSAPIGLCAVFIDHYKLFIQLTPQQQMERLYTVERIISAAVSDCSTEITVTSPDRRYLLVIYNSENLTPEIHLIPLLKTAQEQILAEAGCSVTIVFHNDSASIDQLDTLYKECMISLHQRLFTGWNSLIRTGETIPPVSFTQEEFSSELKKLNDQLVHGNLEDGSAFSKLLRKFTYDWLGYQTALLSVRSQLEQDILVLESSKRTVSAENLRENLVFDSCETMEEIDAVLLQTIQLISSEYANADQQRQQGYIDEVERLIRNNYQNCDYGVQQIASDLGLSNTYISKLYKDLTGVNIIEKLTKYRMEAAVCLLLETDTAATDIYNLVGYSSVNYFYRVFKKYYGVTPGQYRDTKGGSR